MKYDQMMDADEQKFWMIVGNDIAQKRRSHGRGMAYDKRRVVMSQKALADVIGLSRCSVANIEAGRQRVTFYIYTKIMEALK